MFEAAVEALGMVFDPIRIIFMLIGTSVGLTIGILPGLSGTVGMSILLLFIYGLDPYTGMAMLIGMTAVVHTGDTFPSVLLGVPGSSGSQATIMDGYPLAKRGEASRALGAAFFCSMVGGVIGGIVLFTTIPIARPLILSLGSPELFMLSILGLSVVGILSGKSPLRGVLAGCLGLLMGSIGGAPAVAEYRYTFEVIYLFNGIPLAVLAIGLFAFPEMLDLLAEKRSISESASLSGSSIQGIKDSIREKWLVLRSAVLGAVVGFVPGLGGSVVDWINYGVAVRTCKNPENFGKGDIRGIIAPESSNNAKEGGALIPTLLFGIPGSGTTAMLLGGLTLMGLQAGPGMIKDNLTLTLSIIWTLVLANIVGTMACLSLSKYIARLSLIKAQKLVPFLLIIMLVGSYQSTRHWGDIYAFVIIGILGWFMKQLEWPRPPLLIGFVLASATERYLWISMSRYGFTWLTHPGVIIIGILVIVFLGAGYFLKSNETRTEGGYHG